jgi:hypothetical protein
MNLLSKDIIKDWGLSSLSSERQVELMDRLDKMLYQAILVKSLDILSDPEQTELDNMLEQDLTTPKDVLRFLESKIPTFERLVTDESQNLKEELFAGVA